MLALAYRSRVSSFKPSFKVNTALSLARAPHHQSHISRTYAAAPSALNSASGNSGSTTTTASHDIDVVGGVTRIKDLKVDTEVKVAGWVRTSRNQKTLSFIQLNDGSTHSGLQAVLPPQTSDTLPQTGASVVCIGNVIKSQGAGQDHELQVTSWKSYGSADSYPLAKKRHTLEYLRTLPHLRHRTNTVAAIARVRSTLSQGIHRFFESEGCINVMAPIITTSDCEGAGEMFTVNCPTDEEDSKFFNKDVYLSVSGQLACEALACGLGSVYTFGPTFRAENSNTKKHLAEFYMLEPELAFCDKFGAMSNCERLVKYLVSQVWSLNPEEMNFFASFYDKTLPEKRDGILESEFAKVSYTEAVEKLQEEIKKDPSKWQFPSVTFGTDLQTEHERWLCETYTKKPTFIYDYPTKIKPFYMRLNEDPETVAAFDLLVPGIGELVGGSQREERLDVLEGRMEGMEGYEWYKDLRRYGTVPHSGYGMGFERLICYLSGVENIREANAFPRSPGVAEM
ncbi:hypothetical protein TrST_g1585 [Triparma strigata]|uniref:asparagine--tRNA ligase n=1 Tax=Triparma strigata TaxID=1606541 RepID=A0A9W6ZXH4_9STRA|nr:hypothetical protein TrST_g1585 [Triparma strigata]